MADIFQLINDQFIKDNLRPEKKSRNMQLLEL